MCQEISYRCGRCTRTWRGLRGHTSFSQFRKCKNVGRSSIDQIRTCSNYNPCLLQKNSRYCPACKPEKFEKFFKDRRDNGLENSEEEEQKSHDTSSANEGDRLNATFAAALASTITPTGQQQEAPDSSGHNGYQPQQGDYLRHNISNGKEKRVGGFSHGQPYGTSGDLREQYGQNTHPLGQSSLSHGGEGGGAFSQSSGYQPVQHPHQQHGNIGQYGSHASHPLGFQDGHFTQTLGHSQGQPVGSFLDACQTGSLSSHNHPILATSSRESTIDHQGGTSSNPHPTSSAIHRSPMDYPAKLPSNNPPVGSAPPRTVMDYPGDAFSHTPPKHAFPNKTAMDYPGNVPSSNRPQQSASTGWPSMESLRKAITGGQPKPHNTQSTQPSSKAGGNTSAFDYPGAQNTPGPSHRPGLFGHSSKKPDTSMGPPSVPASAYRSTLSSSARHADKAAKRRNRK